MFNKVSKNDIELIRDVVLNELRNAILENKLKDGDRLVEHKIASDMGISRTPVREALRQLERDGLAIANPRKGTIVAGISIEDVLEIYNLIEVLEGLAIRLACLNLSRIDIRMLIEKLNLMENNIDSIFIFEKLYMEFNSIILKSTNSKKLIDNLVNIQPYLKYLRKNILNDYERRNCILHEYRKLMRIIEEGNEILAERDYRLYIFNEKEYLIKRFS